MAVDPQQLIISLVHLGCCKNLVDSEKILGQFANAGYMIAQEPRDSHVVLINTCGFIESARNEAKQTIAKILQLKKKSKVKAVIAIGCMVQLYAKELQAEFPTLDGTIGFSNYDEICQHVQAILNKQQNCFANPTPSFIPNDELRLRVTFPHYTYLRITEGCSNCCNYCTIPRIRGKMRSKTIANIIQEAKLFIADGAKELIVIGQDTAGYGQDLPEKTDLYDLVQKLVELNGLEWLRIMYVHPSHVTSRLFDIFRLPHVLPYLEMPIQHIHPRILKDMGRGHSDTHIKELIQRLRTTIPGLILRSTVMVGFPGETEEEFETLLNFIHEVKFERLGAFMYSQEPQTKASEFPDNVAPEIKKSRYEKVMAEQQNIAFAWAKQMIGRELKVVMEEPMDRQTWRARSYGEAPEIDPAIYVHTKKATVGTFRQVKILQNQNYDLIGKLI